MAEGVLQKACELAVAVRNVLVAVDKCLDDVCEREQPCKAVTQAVGLGEGLRTPASSGAMRYERR